MFGFAWLTLRQVQEALKTGRLEEALRLLRLPGVRNHRRAGQLLLRLTQAFAERGERHLASEAIEPAWADLLQAEALQTSEKAPERLRQSLVRLGMAELRGLLLAGEAARAEEAVHRLRQRQVTAAELGVLEEGTRAWLRAREAADRGEMAIALDAAERAGRLLGGNERLATFRAELARDAEALPRLLGQLHDAANAERWRDVLELCEKVLAMSPAHAEARSLRAKAWRALEPAPVVPDSDRSDKTTPGALPVRFWLWIDGVGGYLVCMGTRLTFGQALPDARVDVPLVADVSRLHATLARDGEGYVLESARPMQVNGATVTKALLRTGDRFTLGPTCQFVFRLPVPGSATARVDLTNGQRLPMSVDGVVLMSETLLIGPTAQAHVTAPDLEQQLVLFRHKDGLGVRYKGEVHVNGQLTKGRAILPPVATVRTADLAFAIEPTK